MFGQQCNQGLFLSCKILFFRHTKNKRNNTKQLVLAELPSPAMGTEFAPPGFREAVTASAQLAGLAADVPSVMMVLKERSALVCFLNHLLNYPFWW